jgi:hypothetical protein
VGSICNEFTCNDSNSNTTSVATTFAGISALWTFKNEGLFNNPSPWVSTGSLIASRAATSTWQGRLAYSTLQSLYDYGSMGIDWDISELNSISPAYADDKGMNIKYEDGYFQVQAESGQEENEASKWYDMGYQVYINGELYDPDKRY